MNRALIKLGYSQATLSLKEKTFNTGFFNLLLYASEVNSQTGELKDVFVFDEREKEYPVIVTSHTGSLIPISSPDSYEHLALMKLHDGKIYQKDRSDDSTQVVDFHDYSLYLKNRETVGGEVLQTRMLTSNQLLSEQRRSSVGSRDYKDYSTEIWKRITTSISPFIFCFLGIGLGTLRTRTKMLHDQSRGILVTFLAMTFYWSLLVYITHQCTEGNWPAPFAIHLPNLAVAVIAYFSFRHANKC
jgi:lipopolysaccharide export system permease protein